MAEHNHGWGKLSAETKAVARQGARALDSDAGWQNAAWPSLEEICDPLVLEFLQDSVEGWATAAPDEDATTPTRVVEHALVEKFVPIAYLTGRLATGTADRRLMWPPEQADDLLDEFNWMCAESEEMFDLPGPALEMIADACAAAGYAENDGLLNVVTMAHDDALMLSVFEYDHLVAPQ